MEVHQPLEWRRILTDALRHLPFFLLLAICCGGCAEEGVLGTGLGTDETGASDSGEEGDPACPQGCDDENPCTFDECIGPHCGHEILIGVPCDDGNACTPDGATVCQTNGSCGGTSSVNCKDQDPCTMDLCDSEVGCIFIPLSDGGTCNDGDSCTVDDACVNGACMGAPIPCADDDNSCTLATECDVITGDCVLLDLEDGSPCDDGNLCTSGDLCASVVCVSTGQTECYDGNPCTDDTCTPKSGCVFQPNVDWCDDDDTCTLSDKCLGGQCKGDPFNCDDDNPCTDDKCGVQGCFHTAINQVCNDGNACTTGDTCVDGTCGGTLVSCNDGNACTDDGCNPSTGTCTFAPNSSPCSDPENCMTGGMCAGGDCTGGVSGCDDGNACTIDFCEQGGCTAQPMANGIPCNGGNCSIGNTCQEGECIGFDLCDDGNSCSDDVCVGFQQCEWIPLPGSCDDGSVCTTGDHCEGGLCLGTAVNCDDDNACTLDVCNLLTGCQYTGIASNGCDDGLECTMDYCDPLLGCGHTPIEGECAGGAGICLGLDCCIPQCGGALCGSNGCGGTCGVCDPGKACVGGACQTVCIPSEDCGIHECLDLSLNACVNLTTHIPSSPLWMGCNSVLDSDCALDEVPQHKVQVNAFDMDVTEVSNRALAAFVQAQNNLCAAGSCVDSSDVELEIYKPFDDWIPEPGRADHPAVQISWFTAQEYCLWVGKRLPHEAEWEKAARGGCDVVGANCQAETPIFPWGNAEPTCSSAIFNSPFVGCGTGDKWPVGSALDGMGPYGTLDLSGNVWEWVGDWYAGDYFCNGANASCLTGCSDCMGENAWKVPWVMPEGAGTGTHRVVRGGGYFSLADFLRASSRTGYQPNVASKDTGFRCAIPIE